MLPTPACFKCVSNKKILSLTQTFLLLGLRKGRVLRGLNTFLYFHFIEAAQCKQNPLWVDYSILHSLGTSLDRRFGQWVGQSVSQLLSQSVGQLVAGCWVPWFLDSSSLSAPGLAHRLASPRLGLVALWQGLYLWQQPRGKSK